MSGSKTLDDLLGPSATAQILDPVVTAVDVHRAFGRGAASVAALRGVSVEFGRGQLTAIMGPSGSGKSTLLRCLAGIDPLTSGSVRVGEIDLAHLKGRRLARMRLRNIGFIFRSFNLVPTLTVRENITLSADVTRQRLDQSRLDAAVRAMGLTDRLDSRPSVLSAGQQQRVACARALVTDPTVIFADEPAGDLDTHAAFQLLQVLRRMVDEFGQSIVVATHEVETAVRADRVIFIADGVLVGELNNPTRESILSVLADMGEQDDLEYAPVNWIPPVADPRVPAPTPQPEASQKPEPTPVAAPSDDATEELGLEFAPDAPDMLETPTETAFDPPIFTKPWRETDPGETTDEATPIPMALEEALDQIAPAPHLPGETVKVIDFAQQILSDLPGSVVDEYTQDGES